MLLRSFIGGIRLHYNFQEHSPSLDFFCTSSATAARKRLFLGAASSALVFASRRRFLATSFALFSMYLTYHLFDIQPRRDMNTRAKTDGARYGLNETATTFRWWRPLARTCPVGPTDALKQARTAAKSWWAHRQTHTWRMNTLAIVRHRSSRVAPPPPPSHPPQNDT